MKNILKFHLALSMTIFCFFSCTKESKMKNNGEIIIEEEIDSFKYLTPCLVNLVTDFESYVLNDTIPHNNDYVLIYISRLQVDSINYYWLITDKEDESEFILTEECDIFCSYNGWTGYDENCLSEFKDSTWIVVWQK